jgi:hypothetical protein
MNNTARIVLSFILTIVFTTATPAQISLTSSDNTVSIDFENAVPGVNPGIFDGSGFSPMPSAGQLDSDAWEILGFSDGDLLFGGTALSGDLARGTRAGTGTSTGGLYALADFPSPGGMSLAFQSGGTDFTPGSITLRVVNADLADTISELAISYDIYERNDADRSSYLNLSYSYDNLNFTPLTKLDHATPEAADDSPSYAKVGGPGPSRSTVITGTSIAPNGGEFFLRWESDDFSGTGSRDEIAIDNISVASTFLGPTAAPGSIIGTVKNEFGRPLAFVGITLSASNGSAPRFVITNPFGRFQFPEVVLGETYILQAFSGRYMFDKAVLVVPAADKITSVSFVGREHKSP